MMDVFLDRMFTRQLKDNIPLDVACHEAEIVGNMFYKAVLKYTGIDLRKEMDKWVNGGLDWNEYLHDLTKEGK